MENDYAINTAIPLQDLKSVLMGGVREDIVINGEPTGEFYHRETGKVDHSTINNLTAALKCFLEGDGFEDIVRRPVALGGDSCTITSMASALAQAFHKEIPEDIVRQCKRHMPMCRARFDIYDKYQVRELMGVSRFITSDDVFAHLLDVRQRNENLDFKRKV